MKQLQAPDPGILVDFIEWRKCYWGAWGVHWAVYLLTINFFTAHDHHCLFQYHAGCHTTRERDKSYYYLGTASRSPGRSDIPITSLIFHEDTTRYRASNTSNMFLLRRVLLSRRRFVQKISFGSLNSVCFARAVPSPRGLIRWPVCNHTSYSRTVAGSVAQALPLLLRVRPNNSKT
jgi:hypothetical protein